MKTSTFRAAAALLSLVTVFAAGCGPSASTDQTQNRVVPGQPIAVVCTTNVIKDLVQQIGGNRVKVTAIMDGPGIDPHTYTPSPKDTNALTAADVVVYSGLHLEGQFDDALESLKNRGIPVICVTDVLLTESPSRLIQAENGSADPHVWFHPELWQSCGHWLALELTKFDPSGKDEYESAAVAFTSEMEETLTTGRRLLEPIPKERRVLVTAHDAFEYFARAFEFEVQAVQGISTESEPGLRRINELIDLLTKKKIAAVFTEQSVSDKNISALIEGCETRGHKLKIGGRLFSDTVGAAGTSEETLSGALLYNIRQVSTALLASEEPQL